MQAREFWWKGFSAVLRRYLASVRFNRLEPKPASVGWGRITHRAPYRFHHTPPPFCAARSHAFLPHRRPTECTETPRDLTHFFGRESSGAAASDALPCRQLVRGTDSLFWPDTHFRISSQLLLFNRSKQHLFSLPFLMKSRAAVSLYFSVVWCQNEVWPMYKTVFKIE